MRTSLKALAVTAGAALLLAAGASSVSAQSAQAADCIKKVDGGRELTGNVWVKIRNDCAWTYDIKVVWKFSPDSTCKALSPDATRRYESTYAAVFDKVVLC
ncbi:hypothetical protein [Nonomuraea sp. NPDC050202]|jgi:uncharacterized membrane protein|uniref:hypothetical protein n=1 Tax=unclassified Nonomuraea TaxID=2593643 RepID=UPI0033FB4EFA